MSCWNAPVFSASSGDVVGSRRVRSAFVTCPASATGSSATVKTVVVVVGNVVVTSTVVLAVAAVVGALSVDDPAQPTASIATKMGAIRRITRD